MKIDLVDALISFGIAGVSLGTLITLSLLKLLGG